MKRLALLCLLPLWLAAQTPPASGNAPDPVAEKFQKFQREIRDAGPAEAPESAPEPRSLPLLAFEIAVALAAVLALAVLGIRLLRKAQRGMLASNPGGDLLEVVETCHVGPGQRLVAVRMDGKIGVVGVTRESISLLTTLERPAGEVILDRRGRGNPALFSDNLNKMLERFKKPKKVSEYPQP
jgi:flagellar biogenesis protein FliO